MGGLHVTALPEEAALHADTIITGPGEEAFPRFVEDFRNGHPFKRYEAKWCSIEDIPAVRRGLIKRDKYFVQNLLLYQEVGLTIATSVTRMLFIVAGSHSTQHVLMLH